jgi:hypothetical protein
MSLSEFSEALKEAKITITKYDLKKQKPVYMNSGPGISVEKFSTALQKSLLAGLAKYPKILEAAFDPSKMDDILREHAEATGVLTGQSATKDIPDNMKSLRLMYDMTAKGMADKFFLINDKNIVSPISGEAYIDVHQIKFPDAVASAEKVIPRYLPRNGPGTVQVQDGRGDVDTVFNKYIPPMWVGSSTQRGHKDQLPKLFSDLVNHLLPLEIEREYLYHWLYMSMFERAPTFLVLCGDPGIGKNMLKRVFRALHGHENSVDGKKSSLTDKFNAQFCEVVLNWMDELKYNVEMENTMKELQNDTLSIERKGVDATRSTAMYASIVISNNNPRDNYIGFDSRKFTPLFLNKERLETSMTPANIDLLSRKVSDPTHPDFSVPFITQIALWIKKHGKSDKWPNCEYRGPMFWYLAQTSMTRWQKRAIDVIMEPLSRVQRMGYDSKNNRFLWSTVHSMLSKKGADKSVIFPDASSVQAFFETYRDRQGRKAFETELLPGDNIFGDFYVRPLFASLGTQRSSGEGKEQNGERKETDLDYL